MAYSLDDDQVQLDQLSLPTIQPKQQQQSSTIVASEATHIRWGPEQIVSLDSKMKNVRMDVLQRRVRLRDDLLPCQLPTGQCQICAKVRRMVIYP